MSLLAKLRFDPSRPIIARTGARAIANNAAFACSALIQQHLRMQHFGVAVAEGSGVDGMNEAMADEAAKAEAERVRAEQGFTPLMKPLELAALMKVIRNAINEDLVKNAGRKENLMKPGTTLPDNFHIAQSFEDVIAYQLRSSPRVQESVIKNTAKALNISEEEVRAVHLVNNQRQLNYLRENEADVIKCFHELTAYDASGQPYTTEMDETVFDSLPAMNRLRMAAWADKGLFGGRANEITQFARGSIEAKGNLALLDGTRREILAEVGRWLDKQQFKLEIEDAQKRGQQMPQFAPAPHVQAPEEAELARSRHAATK